ncbi:MAG: PEP-CTERM sorting domain-containing protein [Phycisphaerales bacterium]
MKRHFLAFPVIVLLSMFLCSAVQADLLSGLPDVTVVDDAVISLNYEGTDYVVADGDLLLGTTTRWFVIDSVEYLWPDGDPQPAGTPTVSGTSSPKEGDIGAKADNFLFRLDGSNDISSIDGIDFQETVFPILVDTIFVFERGGNDNGTVQAILADDTLGTALELIKNGAPYAATGVNVGGQGSFGYVLTTDVPVKGLRITASGHDSLSISAIPEPATIALLGLGGLALLRRRRS